MAFTFAVSISDLLGNVGTVAGLIAALAVAVLATVVLGQGSEVKRLRDEVDAEADRAYAAEAALAIEVASAARNVPQAMAQQLPVAAAPASVVAIPEPAAESLPPASAGIGDGTGTAGAPALGSATVSPVIAAQLTSTPEPADQLGEEPALSQVPEIEPGSVARTDRPAPIVIPSPAAATAAARTDVASKSIGDPSTSAAGGGPRAPRPPVREGTVKKGRNPIPVLVAAVLVIVAIVFGINQFGGSSSDTAKTGASPSTTSTSSGATTGSGSIVAVLNGTPVSGLAGQVAGELEKAGFKRGRVASARDQQTKATIVAYMPGHAADAEAAAKALGIDASVVPADDAMQAVACPDAATCTAEVIVTVGADRTR